DEKTEGRGDALATVRAMAAEVGAEQVAKRFQLAIRGLVPMQRPAVRMLQPAAPQESTEQSLRVAVGSSAHGTAPGAMLLRRLRRAGFRRPTIVHLPAPKKVLLAPESDTHSFIMGFVFVSVKKISLTREAHGADISATARGQRFGGSFACCRRRLAPSLCG